MRSSMPCALPVSYRLNKIDNLRTVWQLWCALCHQLGSSARRPVLRVHPEVGTIPSHASYHISIHEQQCTCTCFVLGVPAVFKVGMWLLLLTYSSLLQIYRVWAAGGALWALWSFGGAQLPLGRGAGGIQHLHQSNDGQGKSRRTRCRIICRNVVRTQRCCFQQ